MLTRPRYKSTAYLHACIIATRPAEVQKCLARGADAHELYSPDSSRYNGNAFHAHASIAHANYLEQDVEIVSLLMQAGVDINARNLRGETPLIVAAKAARKHPSMAACLRDLIRAGADVNMADNDGMTALHHICADRSSHPARSLECAAALFEAKLRHNARDSQMRTPLMLAAASGNGDLYTFLALKDADIHLQDREGRKASEYAAMAQKYALAEYIRARENQEPQNKPSFPAHIQPQVEWNLLDFERISKTTIEEPIKYRITEIFNFRARTYTCISQNIYTKQEAMVVKTFDEFEDSSHLDMALRVLERKGGHTDPSKVVRTKKITPLNLPK